MPFRLCAKKFLLTYPQHDGTKEELLDHLRTFGAIKQYVICRELHSDGHPHLHACIEYDRKVDTTNPNHFDFQEKHGNYQSVRRWVNAVEYVKKGDDFIEEITSSISMDWPAILEAADSEESFMDLCLTHKTRDYVLNHEKLEYIARKRWKPTEIPYTPVWSSFNIPDVLQEWVSTCLRGPVHYNRFRGLILIGPTQTGKTQWARSLGQHSYFQSMFSLDYWRGGIAIFDDVSWEYVTNKKVFFGGQREPFFITDKYRKKTQLCLEQPSIFLCNPEDSPFLKMKSEAEAHFFNTNNVVVQINAPLF